MERQVGRGDLDVALTVCYRLFHKLPLRSFGAQLPAYAPRGATTYAATGVSQSACFSAFPLTVSKNAFCMRVVIGPRFPSPIVRPSTSRIGVTSAAVPVKNASSAI